MHLRGKDNFFLLAEKKEQEIFCSRMWACIFGVKWYTVGIHNAIARSGLEKNSSEDVSLWKEKAPLLQWIFWLKKSGLITFLKILLSCRWIYWTFASAKDETPWWRVVSEWHFNPKEKKTSSRRWDKDISIDLPLDPHHPPHPHPIFFPLAFVK